MELPAKAIRKKSTSPSASSPITSARYHSPLPMESFRRTRAAVTFCVASCAAPFATAAPLVHELFFFKLVDVVAQTMGDVFS